MNDSPAFETLLPESGFWQNKRVLITGHTGFKGAWLAVWLNSLGAKVTGYALPPPTSPSLYAQAGVQSIVNSIIDDISDFPRLSDVIRQTQPDIIFHLAAQALVRASYQSPVATYATNVMGTINVLEAVRQAGGTRVVQVITSDKCYDNPETGEPLTENHPFGGKDPYSSSKGCAELVAASFRHSFFKQTNIDLATVRAGNVIGGGDWAVDRIIPDAIRAADLGTPLILRHPNAVRPWQFVLEPLAGYLWLAQLQWRYPKRFAEGWNFGPEHGDPVTVGALAEQFYTDLGKGNVTTAPNAQLHWHEANLLQLAIDKAKNLLNWAPAYTTSMAIQQTAEWYANCPIFASARKTQDYCLMQIETYTRTAREKGIVWAQ